MASRSSDLKRRARRILEKGAVKAARGVLEYAQDGSKEGQRPWDRQFLGWIEEARARGEDPNDVADEKWSSPLGALERHYFPLIGADATVMELGPGTGRYTRHLFPRCREMILVDYSQVVCDWMHEYFTEQNFRTVLATSYDLVELADGSIDTIVANGVFEHIYLEGIYRYLKTFRRILKPGGKGCFNFDNIMSTGGIERFEQELPEAMDARSIFRFYHPEMITRLAERAGLEVVSMDTSEHRFAYLTFARPR